MPELNIIPYPSEVRFDIGNFILDNTVKIINSDAPEFTINYLKDRISIYANINLKIVSGADNDKYILFKSLKSNSVNGSYQLVIENNKIEIYSASNSGFLYAVQTLLQILPTTENSQLTLPAMTINDAPRFQWRGMLLDVSRHFFTVEEIKKYIDLIAIHKMNVFHWHLVDDQGWRIEIKRYPKLTEIGAWRTEPDGSTYGGFYSQDEIKEIVAYASERSITIVPEIEMPGHSMATLAAYPDYSCTGEPFEIPNNWGIFKDVYCAGKEETFTFLRNVLGEIIDLFPGEYIHIGGDECPKDRWTNCELCQQRITSENLKNEFELQSYFIKRIGNYLQSKNKNIIGWDEIAEGGIPEGATVMAWRDINEGIKAARVEHNVIMTPMSHCYFDHYQAKDNEPKAIGGFTPLEKVYSFDPVADLMTNNESKYILGAQGNVWTEYMDNFDHVQYMILPRMCALSEVLWHNQKHLNFDDFYKRLAIHLHKLHNLGYNYRPV